MRLTTRMTFAAACGLLFLCVRPASAQFNVVGTKTGGTGASNTGASGKLLIGQGTDFLEEALSGDASITSGGALTVLGFDGVLLTAGTPSSGQYWSFDSGSGKYVLSNAPGGSGTVTSVALSMPAEFSVSGSPVTSSGTFTVTKATQSANTVFAGPSSGGAASPTFRALVAADMPSSGAGSGTVTSFSSGDLSPLFTTSVATSTTTPALTFAISSAPATSWFGNPDGTSGTPAYNTGAFALSMGGLGTGINLGTLADILIGNGGGAYIEQPLTGDVSITSGGVATVVPATTTTRGAASFPTAGGLVVSAGAVSEAQPITAIGSGLSLSGGTLSASGGGGSGTVNSGTSGQVAYYASTGATVSGESQVTPGQGGFGASATGASGKIPIGQGSTFTEQTVSGDATITSGGVVTVKGIQGKAVSSSAPSSGQFLQFNGTQYAPVSLSSTDVILVNASIIDDNFNRANTSAGGAGTTTGLGNGWIDAAGNVWNISSDLAVTVNGGTTAYKTNFAQRPSSENCTNQRIVAISDTSTIANQVMDVYLRQQANGDAYMGAYTMGNSGAGPVNLAIYKVVGGTLTQLVAGSANQPAFVAGHQYQVDFSANGTSATTLTLKGVDITAGGSIFTTTVTDSTAAFQTSGGFGFAAHSYSGTNTYKFSRVLTFNLSNNNLPTPSLGTDGNQYLLTNYGSDDVLYQYGVKSIAGVTPTYGKAIMTIGAFN